MGMKEGASKFKPVDDLFISDSDDDSPMDLESPDTEDGPSTKRLKTGDDDDAAALAEEKPKWSNPDPYYLIPPLDESRGKRKDVVHLLRKAKVETEKSGGVTNAVSRNADFIGFSDEDEQEFARDGLSEEGEIDSDQHMQPDGNRDSGAQPKTARNGTSATSLQPAATLPAPGSSFSHRQNLHQLSETNIMVAQDVAIQPTPRQETADIDVLDEARALLQQYKEEATVQSQKQKNDATQQGKKRKLDADGGITKPWTAKDRASSAPWHIDHSAASSTTFW
jgi:non-canonical poly(A) RNA polymerase PAPD5/7